MALPPSEEVPPSIFESRIPTNAASGMWNACMLIEYSAYDSIDRIVIPLNPSNKWIDDRYWVFRSSEPLCADCRAPMFDQRTFVPHGTPPKITLAHLESYDRSLII